MSIFRIRNDDFSSFYRTDNTAYSLLGMEINNNLSDASIGDVLLWDGKSWTHGTISDSSIHAYGFDPVNSSVSFGGITGAVPVFGDRNTVFGTYAGTDNTYDSADNVFIGYDAASMVTGLDQSVVIGSSAGHVLTSGATGSVFIGFQAGHLNTSGFGNTSLGTKTLLSNVSGHNLTAIGYQSLQNATAGLNTALGYSSLSNVTSGVGNVGIGSNVGSTLTTGSNNVIIGTGASTLGTNVSNSIVIGANASTIGSYGSQLMIGSLANQIDNINIGPNKWFLSTVLTMVSGSVNNIFKMNLPNNKQVVACIVNTNVKASTGVSNGVASNLSSLTISAVNSNGVVTHSLTDNGNGNRIAAGGALVTNLGLVVTDVGTSVVVSMDLTNSNNNGYDFYCRLNIQNIGVDNIPIQILL